LPQKKFKKKNKIELGRQPKSEVLGRTCWGTHWELEGNIVGTHWEPVKNGKKKPTFPTTKLKRKKKARRLDKLGVLIYLLR
jgi:hypothetical protein